MKSILISLIMSFASTIIINAQGSGKYYKFTSKRVQDELPYIEFTNEGDSWKIYNLHKATNEITTRYISAPFGNFTYTLNFKDKVDSIRDNSGNILAIVSFQKGTKYNITIPNGPTYIFKKGSRNSWKYYLEGNPVLTCQADEKNKVLDLEFFTASDNIEGLDILLTLSLAHGTEIATRLKATPVFVGIGILVILLLSINSFG